MATIQVTITPLMLAAVAIEISKFGLLMKDFLSAESRSKAKDSASLEVVVDHQTMCVQ
jgi:hypothetical protein